MARVDRVLLQTLFYSAISDTRATKKVAERTCKTAIK